MAKLEVVIMLSLFLRLCNSITNRMRRIGHRRGCLSCSPYEIAIPSGQAQALQGQGSGLSLSLGRLPVCFWAVVQPALRVRAKYPHRAQLPGWSGHLLPRRTFLQGGKDHPMVFHLPATKCAAKIGQSRRHLAFRMGPQDTDLGSAVGGCWAESCPPHPRRCW